MHETTAGASVTLMADIPGIPDSTGGAGMPTPDTGRVGRGGVAIPWRLVTALVLFGLIVTFALQNTKSVDVNFLFWDFGIPLIVVITATMVISVLFGDIIGWWWRRRKRRLSQEN